MSSGYAPYANVSTEELEKMLGTKLKKFQRAELNRRVEEGDLEAKEVLDAAREREREHRNRLKAERNLKHKQINDSGNGRIDKGAKHQDVATATMVNDRADPVEANYADGEDILDPVVSLAEYDNHDAVKLVVGKPTNETDLEAEANIGFREFYRRKIAHLDQSDVEQDAAIEAGLEVAEIFLAELSGSGGGEIIQAGRSGNRRTRANDAHASAEEEKRGIKHVAENIDLEGAARRKALEDEGERLWQDLLRMRSTR